MKNSLESTGALSTGSSVGPVLPYDGIYGSSVGGGHVNYRKRTCMVCGVSIGDYHADGCPEAYRDLNAERKFDEFSSDEHLIIEELSGVTFQGTGWGGFGDPVTDEEVHTSVASPDRDRYMPPPTRTLQEAIELVKSHFAVNAMRQSPADVRTWARENG
jgi:hypothetical protein